MNLFLQGIQWVLDPAHYGGENGIDTRTIQHLLISLWVLAIAAVIAIPAGFAIGHSRRERQRGLPLVVTAFLGENGSGRGFVIGLSGGVRALPTLGLISIIALNFNVGIGIEAPLIALVVLAVPSILAGAYAGFEAVNAGTIDAARAVGMTEWQILRSIEVPLGLPLLIGGLRSASLQVIATATLADYIDGGGLGHFIFLGIQTQDYPQMLAGSIVVVILALLSEALFSVIQRLVVPAGVRARAVRVVPTSVRTRPTRSSAV
ncbi:MAG: transporter permease [Glaciihabitans sp.]|jgi:osmoprotectant transport system permease protein|nr:transporter permease [Glaciihabitans sp.]MDQ1556191.1 osmoprotectant transport system permease protein [Actinomycetota bacterium]